MLWSIYLLSSADSSPSLTLLQLIEQIIEQSPQQLVDHQKRWESFFKSKKICDPSPRDSFIVGLVGPQGFLQMCQRCGTIKVGSVMSTEYLPKIGVKDWIYAWIIYKLTEPIVIIFFWKILASELFV